MANWPTIGTRWRHELLQSRTKIEAYPLDSMEVRSQDRASIGGKAFFLVRLIASNLPVPRGIVVPASSLQDTFSNATPNLESATRALKTPWTIRSSAAWEDSRNAAAPGVLSSCRDVTDRQMLQQAVTEVIASGASVHARQYHEKTDSSDVSIIVQEQIEGVRGTLYTRLPGQPESLTMLAEATGTPDPNAPPQTTVLHRNNSTSADNNFPVPEHALQTLAKLSLCAESAINATTGADIEWVWDGTQIWLLQARPIVHGSRNHKQNTIDAPHDAFSFSRGQANTVWYWDATHNPLPLSPAQQGLVQHINNANVTAYQQRVVCGYLYTTASGTHSLQNPSQVSVDHDLEKAFFQDIQPAMEDALSVVETHLPATLNQALTAYENVYAIYAQQLGPLLKQSQSHLLNLLEKHFGAEQAATLLGDLTCRGTLIARWLARVARKEASVTELMISLGPLAPVWDVCTPTYSETPELLERAVSRYQQQSLYNSLETRLDPGGVRDRLPTDAHLCFDDALGMAILAHELGELDDLYFARAQAGIRRAMLSIADTWSLSTPEDIFYLPFDIVVSNAQTQPPDRSWVKQQIHEAKGQLRKQRSLVMPLAFADGKALEQGPSLPARLRGQGIGQGRAVGRVVRLGSTPENDGADLAGEHCVVVARTITPATILITQPVGLVIEFGGLLDHGAALARELNIPAVVGCPGAWHALKDGDTTIVDAGTGTVTRIQNLVR